MEDIENLAGLAPGRQKPAKRKRKQQVGEAIIEKPVKRAALDAMTRMLDPVLVVGEAELPSPGETQAASFHNYIRAHIETLQKHLRPGEELFVYVHTGFEIIRVLNMAMPDWHMVVLTGLDVDDNPAQLITNIQQVRFVCKIMRVSPEHKHNPIGFKFPPQPAANPA